MFVSMEGKGSPRNGRGAGHPFPLAGMRVLTLCLVVMCLAISLPGITGGELSDEIMVHDIDPPRTFSQNVTHGEMVHFILVVEYNGTGDDVTILLSNTSHDAGWKVRTYGDVFILSAGRSQVVRVSIWPDPEQVDPEEECSTDVTLRILAVRDSESYELIRTYSVLQAGDACPPTDPEGKEKLQILGFDIDVPEPLDSKPGRFAILVTFWVLLTALVVLMLDPLFMSFAKKTETKLDDMILAIIRKPMVIIIVVYGIIESLNTLDPPSEIVDILDRIYGMVFFAIIILVGYKIFNAILTHLDLVASKTNLAGKVHYTLLPALSKVGTIIFFFLGVNVILGYLGIDLAILLGGMTIMGLVIAFAAQDTLSNFFGGIFLILEPNFHQDDVIMMDDVSYEVREIGMRTTQLYDISNHALVTIPNNILANARLITLTQPDRLIKMTLSVGVAYGTDVDLVEDTLLAIAKAHPETVNEGGRAPFVRFDAFGDSSLNFNLGFWVNDLNNRFRVRHEIMKRVNNKFKELGIEIPFPQRVVHMVNEEPDDGVEQPDPGAPVPRGEPVGSRTPATRDLFGRLSPPDVGDPAATAEVKGDVGKSHREVMRERDARKRETEAPSGNIGTDSLDEGGVGEDGGNGED